MPPPARRSRRSVRPEVAAPIVLVGAVAIALVVLLLAGLLDSEGVEPVAPGNAGTDPAGPGAGDGPDGDGRTPIAIVKRRTDLRASPRGRSVGTIGRRTEFKSARVLAVVGEEPGWLRVMDASLENGERAWIDSRHVERAAVRYALRVDLSARRLEIVKDGRVVRRIRTAVGEQGTPTPTGRYAVTDKVPFTDRDSPYGCCALALTAHQPDTPSEWTGGDRIAIHATPVSSSIGESVTLGCMRVPTPDARWMMRRIPLGTQVSIRA